VVPVPSQSRGVTDQFKIVLKEIFTRSKRKYPKFSKCSLKKSKKINLAVNNSIPIWAACDSKGKRFKIQSNIPLSKRDASTKVKNNLRLFLLVFTTNKVIITLKN